METIWFNKILQGFGFSLTGGLANLIQTPIVIIVIIILVRITLGCAKKIITRNLAGIYVAINQT